MTNKYKPNNEGYFGVYGGQYISDELKEAFKEVELFFNTVKNDKGFMDDYLYLLKNYVGRPSPLYYAKNLTKKMAGAKIYLKREDLNHTGSHKINHCIGEALIAKKMGKKKILAETGAGQHGVALATVAALLGLECEIHMGAIDVAKQSQNVSRMRLLGAKIVEVTSGGQALKDAVDSAFSSYLNDYKNSFFAIGTVVGPHPYPEMVMFFQSIIGREAKKQILEQEGKLPDYLIACVGGGSNAIGLFHDFLDTDVKMIGVEPGGRSFKNGDHAATLTLGKPGIIHGMFTYVLLDENNEIMDVHSVASGLDYPGIGPIHSKLKDEKRVEYKTINDIEAINAFKELSVSEGIIPALESSHALAYGMKKASELDKDQIIIVNLSGRGDKDIEYVEEYLNENK